MWTEVPTITQQGKDSWHPTLPTSPSLTPQAIIDYTNGKPWIKEISAFIREVIGGGPVVIVVSGSELCCTTGGWTFSLIADLCIAMLLMFHQGNSLGAYASLATAAAHPELIR